MVEPAPPRLTPLAGHRRTPRRSSASSSRSAARSHASRAGCSLRHVFDSHKHFDADELVADLQGAGRKVSRATVYRTLHLLVEAGLLRELRLTNRTAYEHDYGYPSHDHLHCTQCDTIVEFNDDEVRRIRESVSLAHGFLADGHRFVITGICPACSRAEPAAAAGPDLSGTIGRRLTTSKETQGRSPRT